MITLSLIEQEALTVRQALDGMLRNEGLPALRRVLAVDDKLVAAGFEFNEDTAIAQANPDKILARARDIEATEDNHRGTFTIKSNGQERTILLNETEVVGLHSILGQTIEKLEASRKELNNGNA